MTQVLDSEAAQAQPYGANPFGVNPLRGREAVRNLLHRSLLEPADFVASVLVRDKHSQSILPAMTLADIPGEARELSQLSIRGVKLFAMGLRKDPRASEAANPGNLMCNAIEAFKAAAPELCVMVETCLCGYTDHGDCVLLNDDGTVDLDGTYSVLAEEALQQVRAGVDVLGPAGMVDGSARAVRSTVDAAGRRDVSVMPHVIVASTMYVGFRHMMNIPVQGRMRRSFQVDISQPEQVVDQARRFLSEGADMLLLEPGLPIVDLVARLRAEGVSCPLTAFSTSGEYLLLKGAGREDLLDGRAVMIEMYSSLKRAGANTICTYAAKELASQL